MISKLWLAVERYTLFQAIRLFRIRGQSERVARGFALGLVVNFFPTFGLGVLISGFVARAFGGNAVAGLIGGSTLTFFWPALFYLNLRVARAFFPPSAPTVNLPSDAPDSFNALAWGGTLLAGAIINTVLIGGTVYLLLRTIHWRVRPAALRYFRSHARAHQQRFSLHHNPQNRAQKP